MLPWLQHATRDPDDEGHAGAQEIADCAACMKNNGADTRRSWGCGFEPPSGGDVVHPWDHAGRTAASIEYDEHGKPTLPVCPGYVCHLPEVLEAQRAHLHWSKSSLDAFTRGKPPTERLLDGVELLEHSIAAFKSWFATRHSNEEAPP